MFTTNIYAEPFEIATRFFAIKHYPCSPLVISSLYKVFNFISFYRTVERQLAVKGRVLLPSYGKRSDG